ncbi:MAG: conjugal transfer protein TraF [Acidobacteriota bacterium]
MAPTLLRALLIAAVVWLTGGAAQAQTLGSRATGLGGAFVAVADDSTAVYWNPAGLATASYASFVFDLGAESQEPSAGPRAGGPGRRTTVRFLGVGTPPLGLAFYRLTSVVAQGDVSASAVQPDPNRQEGRRSIGVLRTTQIGANLLQSLGEGLVVGATVKLVRGAAGEASVAAPDWDGVWEAGEGLDVERQTRADVDLGVMWSLNRVRVGLAVRNLTEPEFGSAAAPVRLARHARAGLAWGLDWPGRTPLVVAVDADLTEVADVGGPRRDVAGGLETWWLGERLGVRAGARASTLGAARPVGAVGASWAVRAGVYVDAHLVRGRDGVTGWGVAGRLAY